MKLSAEILILALMILSNGRVLTIRKPHMDPLTMLAPISFLLASLSLFSFSADVFILAIFLLSILVLLSNFHALIRYSSHLVIDRYSPLMKVWAWFTNTLCLLLLGTILFFSPVNISERKMEAVSTKSLYSGSFSKGFAPSERFETSTGFITEFTRPEGPEDLNTIIILLGDKRGDTESYRPYLLSLAEKGFTVVSGDFYSKDLKWIHSFEDSKTFRRMGLVLRSLINNQKFKSQREFYTYNFSREIETMISLMNAKYGNDCQFFIITDEMSYTAAEDFKKVKPEVISGIFDLSTVPEYITPGYGFIQQTDPFLGKFLGVSRDKKLEAVNACVNATINAINGEALHDN
ncbi:MAG: hypothetical protein MJ185_00345 [Treponema sp.]|nr:hypothetical protein [Treponema sp.]